MRKKYFSRYSEPLAPLDNLVEIQLQSYEWLVKEGIAELFKEFSPIKDYSEKKFELELLGFQFDEPKYDEHHAKVNRLSYETPLRLRVKLKNHIIGVEKEQEIFLSDFPLMTPHGTFVVNGNERVVVTQLARSFGVFFTENELRGKKYFGAKIIPSLGSWVEIDSESDEVIYARIDRKRKFPVSSMLRIFADMEGTPMTDEQILEKFKDTPGAVDYLKTSFARDHAKTLDDSYIEIYRRLRDSDLATETPSTIFCNGQTLSNIGGGGNSNATSTFTLTPMSPKGCVIIKVGKVNTPADYGLTRIESYGYNTCTGGAIKKVERGITITY
jgi:DNA-directed RNA polymerase subunit beta